MVAYFRKQAEKNRSNRRGDAPNVIAETSTGGSQQGRKQRRQIHGKQRKNALAKSNQGKPAHQCTIIMRLPIGADHGGEISNEGHGNRGAVTDNPREPAGKKVSENGGADDEIHCRAGKFVARLGRHGQHGGQIAQMLLMPEHEGPVRRERDGANERYPDCDGSRGAAKEFRELRFVMSRVDLGGLPFGGFGNGPANPENEQRGQHADEEQIARLGVGQQIIGQHGAEDADVHTALQHRRQPWSPVFRPGLGEQRGAHGPFAADAQRGEKAENHQLPPCLREHGQAGEGGVSQHGERERARASEAIADQPKKSAAQRPAEQERALDDGPVTANALICGGQSAEELRDEGRGDERVEMHVQPVEGPAQPRGDAGFPLLAGDALGHRCGLAGIRSGCNNVLHRRKFVGEFESKPLPMHEDH